MSEKDIHELNRDNVINFCSSTKTLKGNLLQGITKGLDSTAYSRILRFNNEPQTIPESSVTSGEIKASPLAHTKPVRPNVGVGRARKNVVDKNSKKQSSVGTLNSKK